MAARRLINRGRKTASVILFKPFIVMAARVLGPGPTRLRLVKLAHNLNHNGLTVVEPAERFVEGTSAQPTSRAA